jgi:hypothetical protein
MYIHIHIYIQICIYILDKLTEEVNEDQMLNLKKADSSVMEREDSLR